MSAPEAILPIGNGVLLMTRIHLRRAQRQSTDPAQQRAIEKALADPDFCTDLTTEGLQASGAQAGGLGPFLQWLIANLPQILALIMALFGA